MCDSVEELEKAEALCGHNIIEFDIPVLEKLNMFKFEGRIVDTLVMSRTLNPDRDGGHSLAAWGKRLGHKKPEHEDWSQ